MKTLIEDIKIITDQDLLEEISSQIVEILGTEDYFEIGFMIGQLKWQKKFLRYNNSFTQENIKTENKKIIRIINMEKIFPIKEFVLKVYSVIKKINESLETELYERNKDN